MGWIIDIIRNYTDAPVVLRAQNVEMMIMKRFAEEQHNFFLREFAEKQYEKFLKYEPLLCEKFDKCIMISKKDEEVILKLNPQIKTSVIPAGIDEFLLQKRRKNVIPYSLVHIGSLEWYPNLNGLNWFIQNIFSEIVRDFPKVKLFIYGKKGFEKLNVPSNLNKNIVIIGYVDNLWAELENKSLAIVPLRIGGGIRIKILELLAFGVNIITTSTGKEGIDVEDGKHILIGDTEDEFAEKIKSFFRKEYDEELLSTNGKDFIKDHYLWDVVLDAFENEYKKLLKQL